MTGSPQNNATDAERWRTLINSPSLRWLGSAGFDFIEGRCCGDTIIVARNEGDYMQLGVDICTAPALDAFQIEGTIFARKLLTTYVDSCRKKEGELHAANGNNKFH